MASVQSAYVAGRLARNFTIFTAAAFWSGARTPWICATGRRSTDDTQPVEYEPEGMGRNTPYAVHCQYANGVKLEMRDSGFMGLGSCHIRYEGEAGWVETADGGEDRSLGEPAGEDLSGGAGDATTNHVRNFVDCVKSRKQPRANALAAGADAYRLPCGLHRIPVGPEAHI